MASKNFDPGNYQVLICKTIEDDEEMFVARVAELPDVAVYESTSAIAYRVALRVITALHDAAVEEKRPFPMPLSSQPEAQFNGRVTVRFSRSDHARISHWANEEDVSLNSLIATTMSRALGERDARRQSTATVGVEVVAGYFSTNVEVVDWKH